MMNVIVLQSTPVQVAAIAAATCYNNKAYNINTPDGDVISYLQRLIKAGHESVIEHIVITFKITKFPRSVLQQLSRHRHTSPSVESTRYTLNKYFNSIEDTDGDIESLFYFPDTTNEGYNQILKELLIDYVNNVRILQREYGIPNDVIKHYMPESLYTTEVLTLNLRELRHILKLRTSNRAMLEFRTLAHDMYLALPVQLQALCSDVVQTVEDTGGDA